ncbi:hypothetical protein [Micromonospora craniellae]|uniref:hypothetical protein n=1 Tax=Micromonospora craniellae TaxID=2294034 RepID=UPI0013146E52|nr:hypothetical protein [Micromonospora craniellae]QOC93678.1 hypothetical protein ID554_08610 [Micromonospora craniellae]
MGLLEVAAQAVHDAACLDVQLFQVGVGHRRLAGAAAGDGFGVGGCLFPSALPLELVRVLVVDFLEFGAGAGEGLGGGGECALVGAGGVVGALHLRDQVVQLGEVGAGGLVGLGWPCRGEALAVRPEAVEVLVGQLGDLAPAGDVPPVVVGVMVL